MCPNSQPIGPQNLFKVGLCCVGHISSFVTPNWVIPVGKEPLALYLQISNMEIEIQEVFCVECVVCVTLIRGVKC